jgi:hypothetical protein
MVKEVGRSGSTLGRCLHRGAAALMLAGILPACGQNTKNAPPTVLNFYPTVGANVAPYTPMYIDFDRALDPTTVQGSIGLTSTVGGVQSNLGANVSYNSELNQIAIIPTTALPTSASPANLTTITVTVFASLTSSNGIGFGGQSFSFTMTTNPSLAQPSFAGATTAVSNAPNTVDVEFAPATDAGTVVYSIFVSTVSQGEDFSVPPDLPTPTTLTTPVSGSPGHVYIRIGALNTGQTYYFIIRAQDQATGNWEFNTVEVSAAAS